MVVYQTAIATIYFNKTEITDGFTREKTSDWYQAAGNKEKEAFEQAIKTLAAAKGAYHIAVNDSSAGADKKQLALLIQQHLGAPLLLNNKAEVFDNATKKRQETIEATDNNTFFFKNAANPFFASTNNDPLMELVSQGNEVVVEVGTDANQTEETGKQDDNKLFTITEQPPAYPGGANKWQVYLDKNLRYPQKDQAAGTQGAALVSFIVEKDGSLTNINCEKAPSEDMCMEAIRLTRESGKWKPAKQNGKIVRAQYTLSINFKKEAIKKW